MGLGGKGNDPAFTNHQRRRVSFATAASVRLGGTTDNSRTNLAICVFRSSRCSLLIGRLTSKGRTMMLHCRLGRLARARGRIVLPRKGMRLHMGNDGRVCSFRCTAGKGSFGRLNQVGAHCVDARATNNFAKVVLKLCTISNSRASGTCTSFRCFSCRKG